MSTPSTLTGYRAHQNLLRAFGVEATLIGFPTPDGVGETIQPLAELGIGAKSRLQDIAAAAMDPSNYPEAGAAAPGPDAYDEQPLTHMQIARIDAALEAAAIVQRDNALVLAILEEAAGAYFAGKKSENRR